MNESITLAQLQNELVRVQGSLFSLGLELEASQRSLRQSQRQGDDLLKFKDRLNSDLQEVMQHREVTEKHNQVSACSERVVQSNTRGWRGVQPLVLLLCVGPAPRPSENSRRASE